MNIFFSFVFYLLVTGDSSIENNKIVKNELYGIVTEYIKDDSRFIDYRIDYDRCRFSSDRKIAEIQGISHDAYSKSDVLRSGYDDSDVVFIVDYKNKKVNKVIQMFVDANIDKKAREAIKNRFKIDINVNEAVSIVPYYYDINKMSATYYVELPKNRGAFPFTETFYCFAEVDVNDFTTINFSEKTIPMPEKILKSREKARE
ncbi:hypothetical protein LJB82_01465 [Desulfovibrio sp. OttesenSCG-928-M16]|nr:hypothetical protein [Desulfovibrio sp. OttesenSCG-928-M16]